jgi:hypothetical protein
MTTVAEQVQYESSSRFRYAVIAFGAAIALVVSQLLQLSGSQSPVSEETISLLNANSRTALNIAGAAIDTIGLVALAVLLLWLHRSAQARQPQLKSATRWVASVGAVIAGVMALIYTVIFSIRAHQFATTGNQSWPQAYHLFNSAIWYIPQLVLELGNLLLAVGVILVALSAMRVGLVTRLVGYTGVISGALFIIGVPVLTPIIQGYWLAATAVVLARRWPSGDPPAWDSGVAVPWVPMQRPPDQRGTRATRERRARVSDKDVLSAVDKNQTPPPNPGAGRSKRKRRR